MSVPPGDLSNGARVAALASSTSTPWIALGA